MQPRDDLGRYCPKWMGGLGTVGIISALGFFIALQLHAMEQGDAFALVRNVCGMVAIGIAALMFMAEGNAEQRAKIRRRIRRVAEREQTVQLWHLNDFVIDLKRQAAEAIVHEHCTDLLHLLAKHKLIDQEEADKLVAEARMRAEKEAGAEFVAPTSPRSPKWAQAVDDEIPF